jgi:hypothetical protein
VEDAVGEYRNEDEGLVGVARELAYAYLDAGNEADAEYAADEISAFLLDRDGLPTDALIALLDLSPDPRTRDILGRVGRTLSARGAEVVGPLLAATLPGSGTEHRSRHAGAIMDGMDERELVAGLVGVLASKANDEIKNVTVGALVGLGERAVHALEQALGDPLAGPWARDALDELRGIRTPAAQVQIEALEAAFAAAAFEPAKPARDRGDSDESGAESDDVAGR